MSRPVFLPWSRANNVPIRAGSGLDVSKLSDLTRREDGVCLSMETSSVRLRRRCAAQQMPHREISR
ncbi:hypothetical protein FQA47_001875 [Oryzias melastigma]|uniref:Uncharacterized protein n=1 Tax=Oryzias melastigma TaxID=30732 RepID=A0A834KW34_ORYME|nr:hypothetical protein FQA47_001875 [Oryzias melastigma]